MACGSKLWDLRAGASFGHSATILSYKGVKIDLLYPEVFELMGWWTSSSVRGIEVKAGEDPKIIQSNTWIFHGEAGRRREVACLGSHKN